MDELLNRYFQDECDPEEQQEVIEYLQNPPNELLLRGQLWQQWNRLPPEANVDMKRLWTDIRQQADLQPTSRRIWKRPAFRMRLARLLIRLGLMLALALAFFLLQGRSGTPKLLYQTGPGQRLTVALPDHSTVVLEENSSLTYCTQEPFTDPSVQFSGTAVFQIAPQTRGRHFVIYTSDRLQFQIRQGLLRLTHQNGSSRMAVQEGVVVLNIENGFFEDPLHLALDPGDLALYDEKANQLVRRREAGRPESTKP